MNEIQKKIAQAEKWNKQLTKVLAELQSKVEKKNQHKEKEKNKQKSEIDEANLKNIERKIDFYKKELENLGDISGEYYLKKIKQSQENIKAIDNKSDFYSKQIRRLQDSFRPKRQNKDQFSFDQYYSNVHTLQKRLNRLQNTKSTTEKLKPIKKKWADSANLYEPITMKKQIDREAMYKNLIKFYENQEVVLKKSIKDLQEQKKQNEGEGQTLDREIKKYEKQIEQARAQLKK